jgi:intracellular multiplication protein IcmE
VNNLFGGWQGRPSRTTVTLAPGSARAAEGEGDEPGRASGQAPPFARAAPAASSSIPVASAAPPPPPAARSAVERVLVPAGRGIYAHTVLAVNSDSGGPIVLEADTGPVAGARMIGSFTRGSATSQRLVVRVTSMQYRGQTIQVDGLVIAPDTMETSVATSVDQHYAARFLLPAAAAFVEGLGQAIATTSNTFSQISPFGGQSFITRLNPTEQAAVAAGAAANRIGRELDCSAPRGPTIHLAANAAVGVMFLTNATAPN